MFPNSSFTPTTFGKPAFPSPGFGAPSNSLFGQPTTQQPSTSLFGNTQPQQQTTFGSGPFGSQPQAPASAGTGFFGNQQTSTSTTGGLFGTNSSTFSQKQPVFGGFGNTSTTSGGLFGQNNMFGQTNQTQPGTSLFGGTNSAFGGATVGTVIKFTPVTSTDTMIRGGSSQTISTRHVCITCMKDYESKSLEELRYEDYKVNRKGPQQGAQTSGGFFGTATQPSMFGASTSTAQPTTSLFGGGENKSLFGQTSAAFGQSTNTFGANNSLFAKPAAATTQANNFAFNSSSTFGQPSTGGIKPFGSTAPQTNNLFGATTSQTNFGAPQTSGFGSFGTTQNQTLNFNQNKPAFNLGNPVSTSFAFGTNTANNTSLFGAKPATNTFGLSTNTASPFGTSSSFGTQPAQTNNLMNSFAKPATGFQFNTNPTPTSLGGNTFSGGSLFGNAAKPTGSLFGNTSSTGLFGNTSFGTTPSTSNTFGQGLNTGFNLGAATNTFNNPLGSQAPPPAPNVNTQQILNLATLPYFGTPTLYKGIVPTTTSSSKLDDLVLPAFQKNRINNKNLTVSPNAPYTVKVKPVGSTDASTKSLFDGLFNASNDAEDSKKYFEAMRSQPKRLVIVPRKNKSLNLNLNNTSTSSDVNISVSNNNDTTPISGSSTTKPLSKLSFCISENEENISPSIKVSDLKVNKSPGVTGDVSTNKIEPVFNMKLTRKGYYTIPSLTELKHLFKQGGPCIIDGFTIGHEEYGNVCFMQPIDASELNELDLDSLVEISFKQVVIYPDDENKPPVGTELNRPAKVTLLKVWPMDRSCGEPIRDVDKLKSLNYEARVIAACKRMNVDFVHYIPETGDWCFKVKHFSKYGLLESEEEAEPEPKKAKTFAMPSVSVAPTETLTSPPVQVKEKVSSPSPKQKSRSEILVKEMNRNIETLSKNIVNLDEMDYFESSSETLARQLGTDPYRVQLLKQYFNDNFESNPFSASVCREFMIENKGPYTEGSLFKACNFFKNEMDLQPSVCTLSPTSEIDRQSYLDEEESVVPSVIKLENKLKKLQVVPIKATVCRLSRASAELMGPSSRQRNIFNVESFNLLDRRFRVAFVQYKRTFLVTCNDDLISEEEGEYRDSCNLFQPPPISNNLLRLVDTATPCLKEKEISFLRDHLQACLQNSEIVPGQNCPFVVVKQGNHIIQDHFNLTEASSYEHQVWKLCVALWGTLESTNHSHDINMRKKRNLTEWLESVIVNTVSTNDSSEEVIFSLVSQHKIQEAIVKAQESNNHNLAVMLAMLGLNEEVQAYIREHLSQYVSVKADNFINKHVLKLMLLVSGLPLYDSNSGIINVCEALNWKLAFGLHLWYLEPSFRSIADVLHKYESAWAGEEAYCLPPLPSYADCDIEFKDLCYHLLVLYSRKSHSLMDLLHPGTHTLNALDFRLSWLMMQALRALGYTHLDEKVTNKYHVSFASQLLSYDLWEWAMFVLMHIENEELRRHHVENILERHVELCASTSDLSDKEAFLIEKLSVPSKWIYNCKGHLAMHKNEFWDACEYYLKAGDYVKCHQVLFDKVVFVSVLNDQYAFLEDILSEIHGNISLADKNTWWRSGGEWLLTYFHIADKLSSRNDQFNLHEISPLVSNFIQDLELKYASDDNGLHKACYSEIFERLVLLLKKNGQTDLIPSNNGIPVAPYILC